MRSDLISKQAAIDALGKAGLINYNATGDGNGMIHAINVIKGLPSAEPEIVRCKDCKRYPDTATHNGYYCEEVCRIMRPDDFCSFAERRTDE